MRFTFFWFFSRYAIMNFFGCYPSEEVSAVDHSSSLEWRAAWMKIPRWGIRPNTLKEQKTKTKRYLSFVHTTCPIAMKSGMPPCPLLAAAVWRLGGVKFRMATAMLHAL
jgi:hypothetical protein